MFSIGSGTRYYNVYPLFHTASVYEGFRRDFGDSRRVMILARAAYLGAQRNGTVFWSSDIVSTWDMLKRSIPAGLELHRYRICLTGTRISLGSSRHRFRRTTTPNTSRLSMDQMYAARLATMRTIPSCLSDGSNGAPSNR